MRYKVMFVAGAALGYVLGTKAGRERYESMRRLAGRVAESPSVQEVAGVLQAQAGGYAEVVRKKVGVKFDDTIGCRIPARFRGRGRDADSVRVSADGHPAS